MDAFIYTYIIYIDIAIAINIATAIDIYIYKAQQRPSRTYVAFLAFGLCIIIYHGLFIMYCLLFYMYW